MADINPEVDYPADGVIRILWETMTSADTALAYQIPRGFGAIGCIQAIGSMGSDGTVQLEASNDGTNWADLPDTTGTAISIDAAAGLSDFSTAALFIRPDVDAGTAEDIDVYVVLRG